jgi:hypothetical protein
MTTTTTTTGLDLNKYNAIQPQSEDFNLFVINLLKDGDSYSLIAGDSNLQYVIEDWMQDVLQLIGIQIKDFDSRIESAVSCNQSFCLLFEADKISYSTTEQVSVKRNKPVYKTTYHSATELPYKLSLTVSCVLKEQEYDEAVSEFKKTQAELDNQFLFDLLKAHNMEDNSGADKLLGKIVAEYGIGQKSTIIKQFDKYIECFK